MGKRQIGELQPSELVVTLIISELVAIPIQNNATPVLHGVVPILTLVSLEIILSQFTLMRPRARGIVVGKPSILIYNGVVDQLEMKKQRYTIDDLTEEIRLKGFMSISEVFYAIVETSGKLSVFPRPEKAPATAQMVKYHNNDTGIPIVLICDGRVISENLHKMNLDGKWLKTKLKDHGVQNTENVFYMTIDKLNNVNIIEFENHSKNI